MINYSRTIVPGIFLFLVCINASAQQQETINKQTVLKNIPAVKFVLQASFRAAGADRSAAFIFQPSAGLLFNEKLYVGIASDLLLNERFLKDASYQPVRNEQANWELNFNGLKMEYSFFPEKIINPGIGLFAGFGNAERNFVWNGLSKQSPEWALFDKSLCGKAYFLFAEPGVMVNVNLSNSVLLRADIGYRMINFRKDNMVPGMTNQKFSKFSAGLTIQYAGLFSRQK